METRTLIGLWEFAGFLAGPDHRIVRPEYGTPNGDLREFLFFDADGTFFFAKYHRDKSLCFDPVPRRFVSEDGMPVLLSGNWRLENTRLIEWGFKGDDASSPQHTFDLEELGPDRLVVVEPAGDGTRFLKVVYYRGDVEYFPAPRLAMEEWDGAEILYPGGAGEYGTSEHASEALKRIRAEQVEIGTQISAGKLNTAHRMAQLSVRHSELAFGADHPHTAGCLCTLGACLYKLGESASAIEVLERAKRIYEMDLGPNDLMTASALNNLAPAYRDEGKFREAIDAAFKAVHIRLSELGFLDVSTAMSIQNLGLALSGIGMLREAVHCYYAAEIIFKDAAGALDPKTHAVQQNIRRLAEAIEHDTRFEHEPLPDPGGREAEIDMLGKNLAFCDRLLQGEPSSDLFTLAYGRAAHTESYRHLMTAIRVEQRLITTQFADQSFRVNILHAARSRLRSAVRAPAGMFSGFLKRVDRSKSGLISQLTLQQVFPNFEGSIEKAKQREATLREFGVDPNAVPTYGQQMTHNAEALGHKIKLVERQFRRFSGENNLPSQRYSSVCSDATGNDRQSLCRELFEYRDKRIAGLVFVGDTWDAALMQKLSAIGVTLPPGQGIIIFLLAPIGEDKRRLFRNIFNRLLLELHGPYELDPASWDGLSIVFIPTELSEVRIEEVIDLRQPLVQDWLFRFFYAGDGSVWMKKVETPISGFTGMIPSLVYPEYGGSGVTKSIGSWMRSAGVQGLVFPSARSNAGIEVDANEVVQTFHGWNFVDYRGTELVPDLLVHVDNNDWYDFKDVYRDPPVLMKNGRSWNISGVANSYEQTRGFLLEILEKGKFF